MTGPGIMDGGETNQGRGFFGRFGQQQGKNTIIFQKKKRILGSEMFQCIHKCMEDSPNRGKGFMCYASLGNLQQNRLKIENF